MGGKMHRKSDSEVTSNSMEQSSTSPTRSPPRRPLYYVQSPSNHDVEKMSYGSSPVGSPHQHFHYYLSSPVHHSRESSTSRYSASLKNPRNHSSTSWKKLHHRNNDGDLDQDDDDGDDDVDGAARNVRLYFCFFLLFVFLFTLFSLILWGASKSYKPRVIVKSIVFENLNVQSGNDGTGVPTDMLSLNSTVRMLYRNPATFFNNHVTSTPLQLSYYQLTLASGQRPTVACSVLCVGMDLCIDWRPERKTLWEHRHPGIQKFFQKRQSQRKLAVVVFGHQVPLYGGVSVLGNSDKEHLDSVALPLNLTFVVRSKAFILGRLVTSKFYRRIRCSVTLHGNKLGKPLNLTHSCVYK